MSIDLFNPARQQLLQKWAHVVTACRHISVWTSDAEIAWLAEAAEGKNLVGELGSYKGKSATAMLMAGAKSVVCCDRFQDQTMPDFLRNLKPFEDRVRVFAQESQEAADSFVQRCNETATERDRQFDFFFVDGSHAKEDVVRDIDIWMPLVKPGGVLAFHDHHPQDPENGIHAALVEKLPNYVRCMDSISAVRIPQ